MLFQVQDPIMLVYLNMDLDESKKTRSRLVADLMTEFGIINLMHHFRKRICFLHLKIWTQVRQGAV